MTHGTPLEWVQFVVAFMGCAIQSAVWANAWRDYRLVWHVVGATQLHQIVARGAMRAETLRLLLAAVFVATGIAAVLTYQEPSPPVTVRLWALVVASCLVAMTALLSQRDRRVLLQDEAAALTGRQELESVKQEILTKISESTEASKAAEQVANDMNGKLEHLNERLVEQGAVVNEQVGKTVQTLEHVEDMLEARGPQIETIVETTAAHTEKLEDIRAHVVKSSKTAPKGPAR